jgi:hypothetical protein
MKKLVISAIVSLIMTTAFAQNGTPVVGRDVKNNTLQLTVARPAYAALYTDGSKSYTVDGYTCYFIKNDAANKKVAGYGDILVFYQKPWGVPTFMGQSNDTIDALAKGGLSRQNIAAQLTKKSSPDYQFMVVR